MCSLLPATLLAVLPPPLPQGLASTTLMACYLWMRRRFSLDPNAVYRLAMLRLNTDPGLLEVREQEAGESHRIYCVAGLAV